MQPKAQSEGAHVLMITCGKNTAAALAKLPNGCAFGGGETVIPAIEAEDPEFVERRTGERDNDWIVSIRTRHQRKLKQSARVVEKQFWTAPSIKDCVELRGCVR
jgi:hypothetical protein